MRLWKNRLISYTVEIIYSVFEDFSMAKMQQLKHLDLYTPNPEDPDLQLLSDIGTLPNQDYKALSQSLFKKGEFRLLHGDASGMEFFDIAMKLDPANADMLLNQGLALFEFGSEEGKEKGLTLASKRFKRVIMLNPDSFAAWHAWGNTLYLLGLRKAENSYFLNAKKKYEKALELSGSESDDVLADLYWDYANIWAKLAHQSEEPNELNCALKAFEKATSFQDDLSTEFYLNYGDVAMKLGQLTNDIRLYVKGINCFKNGVSISIDSFNGWLKLGCALEALYDATHDEDHFSQASECLSTAARFQPYAVEVWIAWSKLLLKSGKISRDVKKLSACIEKCKNGARCPNRSPAILSIWSEALSLIGTFVERLELIYEGQNKASEIDPEDPTSCYPAGVCLVALGRYFKDPDYYYQAIERFQEGLSNDRSDYQLWLALASTYLAAAEIDHDEMSYERSIKFFEKALHLKRSTEAHYQYGRCLLKYSELSNDEEHVKRSVHHFQQALNGQKNAAYVHPEWLYDYACSLDYLAEFSESEETYAKALDLLNHLSMLHPDFPEIHYQIALVWSHHGELIGEVESYHRALHHYRIAHQRNKECSHVILDWGITLLNFAELLEIGTDADQHFREAEYKMIQAAKLGNAHAYYSLAELYSLLEDPKRALYFLEKAHAFDALPPLSNLQEDEWLDNIRDTEAFQSFLQRIEDHQNSFEN